MDKKEMSLVLVRLVKHEVQRATQSLIDAKAGLAETKVRYEYEQKEVAEGFTMGNRYSEQVRRYEVQCESCKKGVEQWTEIQDFVVRTFINNA